ncbi:MAG: TatD family hydrolase [Firmicutes bacterium]|nr:TatD family hydrolase [Bacillota bacterium]
MLFDTHTHLNDDQLYPFLEEVMPSVYANDVSYMLCVGYDKDSSMKALEIAKRFQGVYAAIGFHPTNAVNVTEDDFVWLEENLKNPLVKAVGEIGLDYYWDATHKEKQKEVFIRQIKLAEKYNLPFSVHMRDALEDTLSIIKNVKLPNTRGIMHCYSGSLESAHEFIKSNMMISMGGPVTFKNARVPKEVVKGIDSQYLLIETDAPYLTPHPYRGKKNDPSYLHLIAKEIAKIKEIPYDEVRDFTTQNALQIFKIQV